MSHSKQEIIEKIKTLFEPYVQFICIFGSILESRFDSKSDVDLAIMPLSTTNSAEISSLKIQLEELILRDIDCINLLTADPIITMQVIQNGELIFSLDPSYYHQFVSRKISEYIDFKFSREIVERNLVSERIIPKT